MTKKLQYKSAAVLTVFNAATMSQKGRKDIVNWLIRMTTYIQSKNLAKHLSRRWTARYLYYPLRPNRKLSRGRN